MTGDEYRVSSFARRSATGARAVAESAEVNRDGSVRSGSRSEGSRVVDAVVRSTHRRLIAMGYRLLCPREGDVHRHPVWFGGVWQCSRLAVRPRHADQLETAARSIRVERRGGPSAVQAGAG